MNTTFSSSFENGLLNGPPFKFFLGWVAWIGGGPAGLTRKVDPHEGLRPLSPLAIDGGVREGAEIP